MAGGASGMLKRLFTVIEAAEYVAVPAKRIYNAKRRGATDAEKALFPVPAKRRGKYWVFEKADLDKYASSIPYANE